MTPTPPPGRGPDRRLASRRLHDPELVAGDLLAPFETWYAEARTKIGHADAVTRRLAP